MTKIRLSFVPDDGSALRQNARGLVNELPSFLSGNEIFEMGGEEEPIQRLSL